MSKINSIEAYPLSWPLGYKRTVRPSSSRFNTSFAKARDGLLNELRLMGAKDVIVSSNIPLKRDGMPYANFAKPVDTGIAVYFTWKQTQFVFACDSWNTCEDNMQAINKTVNSFRMMPQWGAGEMMERAFSGFKAIPMETGAVIQTAHSILGVSEDATQEEIKTAYRRLAMQQHPDKGGTTEEWHRINKAYNQLIK